MTKLEALALKHFEYSLSPIEYKFEFLSKDEKEIFQNQETLDVIKKEIEILKT
jgi:hypothetical protein